MPPAASGRRRRPRRGRQDSAQRAQRPPSQKAPMPAASHSAACRPTCRIYFFNRFICQTAFCIFVCDAQHLLHGRPFTCPSTSATWIISEESLRWPRCGSKEPIYGAVCLQQWPPWAAPAAASRVFRAFLNVSVPPKPIYMPCRASHTASPAERGIAVQNALRRIPF